MAHPTDGPAATWHEKPYFGSWRLFVQFCGLKGLTDRQALYMLRVCALSGTCELEGAWRPAVRSGLLARLLDWSGK
jgi:hypothetical protein